MQHMQGLVCVEEVDDGNGNDAGAPDALDNATGLDTSALDASGANGSVADAMGTDDNTIADDKPITDDKPNRLDSSSRKEVEVVGHRRDLSS